MPFANGTMRAQPLPNDSQGKPIPMAWTDRRLGVKRPTTIPWDVLRRRIKQPTIARKRATRPWQAGGIRPSMRIAPTAAAGRHNAAPNPTVQRRGMSLERKSRIGLETAPGRMEDARRPGNEPRRARAGQGRIALRQRRAHQVQQAAGLRANLQSNARGRRVRRRATGAMRAIAGRRNFLQRQGDLAVFGEPRFHPGVRLAGNADVVAATGSGPRWRGRQHRGNGRHPQQRGIHTPVCGPADDHACRDSEGSKPK